MRSQSRQRTMTYSGNGFDDPGDPDVNAELGHVDEMLDAGYYDEWLREV